MSRTTGSPTATALATFAEHGFIVVDDVLSAAECAAFLERNAAHYAGGAWSGLDGHTRDDRFDGVITHPTVLAWARALLGGAVACAQTLVFAKPPGHKGIAFHQESYYVETDPPELLTCWIALERAHAGNGGLALVPGSHRGGLVAIRETSDGDEHVSMRERFVYADRAGRNWHKTLVAAEIPEVDEARCVVPDIAPGGALFFDGRTIHGSTRNRSETESRHAFSAQFVRQDTWIFRADITRPRAL